MKLSLFVICIAMSRGCAWAQNPEPSNSFYGPRDVTLYINGRGELTSPERSVIRRETSMDLETLLVIGGYKDYNKEGKLIADGIFHEGIMRGLRTHYFEN